MIASAHIAAGLVAGMAGARVTKNRPLNIAVALVLGVLSHVTLDAIPHADYGFAPQTRVAKIVIAETIGMLVIAFFLIRRRIPPHGLESVFAGCVGAVLPDAKFIAKLIRPGHTAAAVERFGDHFHRYFHAAPINFTRGMEIQVGMAVLLLASLLIYRRRAAPAKDHDR